MFQASPKISNGIRLIILASFFFSMINALVKYFDRIPAVEIVFFRSLVTLALSFIAIQRAKVRIFNPHFKLLCLRGLFGAIALALYFRTIQSIPLANAVTLLYLAPLFTVIFAIFVNKEKPNSRQWPFLVTGLLGSIFLKGEPGKIALEHFLTGIGAAICAALAYTMIRRLKDKAHHQLIIFYFPFVTIPLILPWLMQTWVTPNLTELIGLLIIGALTQIAQVFMTKAYIAQSAAKISHYNYLTSVWAVITGLIFFNEPILIETVLGIFIIVVSVIMSSWAAGEKKL